LEKHYLSMARLNIAITAQSISERNVRSAPTQGSPTAQSVAGKPKAQRALRTIEHNEILLQRKSAQLQDDVVDKPRRNRIVTAASAEFGAEESGNMKLSKLSNNVEESSQDEDDSLADIDFWTKPKQLSPKIPKALKQTAPLTPRTQRSQRRRGWKELEKKEPIAASFVPEPEEKELISKVSISYIDQPVASNAAGSRPTSSYSNDPRGFLTL
jgi:hypothetical protein